MLRVCLHPDGGQVLSARGFVRETAKPFPDDYSRIKSYNLGLISRDELEEAKQR